MGIGKRTTGPMTGQKLARTAGLVVLIVGSASGARAMDLSSPDFGDGSPLPVTSGYNQGNVSPALRWRGAPPGTKSFALVVDDPDADGWIHWLVWNIPAGTIELPVGVKRPLTQGTNSFDETGWGGPCPPEGTHRYVFTLYALDGPLGLEMGARASELRTSMKGHVLAEARLVGTWTHR